MFLIFAESDLEVDFGSAAMLAQILAILSIFLVYATWRRMIILPAAFGCLAAVFASSVPILLWTYAAINLNLPLVDPQLMRMDAAIGFNWYSLITYVDASPTLAWLLAEAYSSFHLQLLFLPILLVVFRREQRAYAMIFAYYVLCIISSVIGIWYPALGAYVVYGVPAESLSNIDAKFGYFFLEQFHAVREAGPFVMRLDESAGILTFPSVHAGVAALCAWAAWDVKWLRLPIGLLNIAMAVSAMTHGSHYLVDVIAGIAVAGLSASVATFAFYRRLRSMPNSAPSMEPSPAAA